MSNYWIDRMLRNQRSISDKNILDIDKQLRKYYRTTSEKIMAEFEDIYNQILVAIKEGREPSPALLYNLDKYWQMQGQLRNELQKLGDKEISLMSKKFESEWKDIYNSISLPSNAAYSTISNAKANSLINNVWLSDGKTFSTRIWNNVDKLVETLNESLVDCVITGKKPTELKHLLMERFNVSYNSADTIARTEIANIQIQASKQRYQDYGLEEYEYLAEIDERTCPICGALDGKRFKYSEMKPGVNAPPMHPRCRCDIIPVIKEEVMK